MLQIVMVGLGAGAAAGLLFASIVSGSIAAKLLFYLAPLPIMIAALGWSHLAGLIAAALATAIITVLSGAFLIAVPVIAFGAWWLGYLTLLARAPTNGGGTELEWYPIGRLLLWSAVVGTLIVAAAVPNFDQQSLEAALRKADQRIVRDQAVIDLLVVAVPPAAAVFSTITNVLNLWLAARVVKISGRLKRPWPDLSALTLPPSAAGLLAVAALGWFLPALVGILSGAFAASLLMVFAFLGFAVLHTITRGTAGRGFVLFGVYASAILGDWLVLPAVTRLLASHEWIVLRVWPLLAIMALGVAETIFNIRLRLAQRHQPPSLPTQ